MTASENDRRVTRALWALRAYVEAIKAPPISPVFGVNRDQDYVSDLLADGSLWIGTPNARGLK